MKTAKTVWWDQFLIIKHKKYDIKKIFKFVNLKSWTHETGSKINKT